MPRLKYRCPECGKRVEELVGFSHTQDVRCPECGAQAQRAYEGKCLFGMAGSHAGTVSATSGCSGNCSGCSGCHHNG